MASWALVGVKQHNILPQQSNFEVVCDCWSVGFVSLNVCFFIITIFTELIVTAHSLAHAQNG